MASGTPPSGTKSAPRRRPTPAAARLLALLLALPEAASGAPAEPAPAAPPANAEQVLAAVEQALAEGRLEEAERLADAVLAERPDSARALALRGRARFLDRRHVAAGDDLERAVDLGQTDLATLLYFGSTRWENGRPAEAEAVFRRAVEVFAGSWLPLFELGRLLVWQGRFEEAAEVLTRVAAESPSSPEVRFELGKALEGAGDAAGALAAFRRATDLAPGHLRARYGLARALARTGEAEAAARELEVYRDLYRADQERTRREGLERAQLDYGRDLLSRGEVAAATAHLAGLEATPDVLAALGAAREAAGDLGAAVELLERAVGLAPSRKDLRARLLETRLRLHGR